MSIRLVDAVGLMSLPIVAILSGLIAMEKIFVRGFAWFNRSYGMGFITLAALIILLPNSIAMF